MVNTLMESVGLLLIVVGVALVWPPLGWIAAGVLLVVVANVRARRPGNAERNG